MTAAERFAAWGLGLALDDVPSSARAAATRHILDGLGCAIAGARAGAAPYADALAPSGGEPAPDAFRLGVLIHALDYDDTHADALVHATAAVLPAALAAGARANASGRDVLTAAIAGYEVVCRLGAAVRHGFHARGFHATSVCGVFASALVHARLGGATGPETVNALGIAGSFASGSLEFLSTGASTKQIHPGWSAHAGAAAVALARAGAEGPASIFEGEHGMFRAYTGADVDTAALTDGLGARWEVERITIKPTPACQLSHAPLDALRAAGVTDPATVERIEFDLPADSVPIVAEPAASKRAPRTPYDAKFSLPYCAAALLLDGDLGLEAFTPEAIARPHVLALAARVGARAVDLGVAAADAPGRVTVHLTDGSARSGEVKQSRGGPENPLTDDEVLAKFTANGGTDELARTVYGIEDLPDIGTLLAMLQDRMP